MIKKKKFNQKIYLIPSFEALFALETYYLELESPPLKFYYILIEIFYLKILIIIKKNIMNPLIANYTTYRSKIKDKVARISSQKKKLLK